MSGYDTAFGSAGSTAVTGASAGAALGPWGALAGGVIGAGAGFLLGNEATEAQRQVAQEQARRLALGNAQTMGQAQARAGASGVDAGSASMAKYLGDMGAEFARQNQWAVTQANEGAAIGEQGNALGALSGFGGSLFRLGASQNWWQGSPTSSPGTPGLAPSSFVGPQLSSAWVGGGA